MKHYFWKRFFFLIAAMVLPQAVLPAVEINGLVRDLGKIPLVSVLVKVKETGKTTLTDIYGEFTLTVPDGRRTVALIFERGGYHPYEDSIRITGKEQTFKKTFKIYFVPKDHIQEKISVTALAHERESVSVPMAETSVSSVEIQEKISESIVETLSDTAGVHFIGKGGYSVTPSIRGLARRRVLVLVDGMRVTSDRRVGSSASFLPPEFAKRIEVVRSSASVLYGSDAIGGILNIFSRPSAGPNRTGLEMNAVNLNLNSVNKRVNSGITWGTNSGKWTIYSGFQFTRAGDYRAPGDTILHSGYGYYSGILDVSMTDEKRDFYLGYVGGIGKDIGKPERDNDRDKYSVVPSESDHFFRLGYNDRQLIKNGIFHFSLFLDPSTYSLEKVDTGAGTVEGSDTRVLNLGVKATMEKSLGKALSYQLGVEWFSRQGLKVENAVESGAGTDISFPIDKGTRNDYGLFLALNYDITRTIAVDAGIRYTFFSIAADVDGTPREKKDNSSSFFIGVTKKFGSSASLFFNIGRAFRFPSLSESFYTGITGRKYVVGNALLKPESSFNIDAGLKISAKNYFVGFYLFTYRVNNLIERYKNDNSIYNYDNIHQGRIYGGEIEVQYSPVKNVDVFGHYFYYRARSDVGDDSLNDIPAPRLFVGGKVYFDRTHRVWAEFNYLHSFKKSDPGPAEIANGAYNVLNLKGGYYLSSSLFLYFKVANLLNESYYANPDPDIPEAQGINFSTGIHFYF
ncbi:MAG: TonB-dependent receptor [bacterium]|nr:TonB-dependent receptor [bacterium]